MKILHFVFAALTTLSLSANVITPSVAAPTQPTTQFTTTITSGAKQIAVGANHACAITQSDTVKCWGRNDLGQLGDGTTIDRGLPVTSKVVTKSVKQIAADQDETCALYVDGTVTCWGSTQQYWDSTIYIPPQPVQTPEGVSSIKSITLDDETLCGVQEQDQITCWALDNLKVGFNSSFKKPNVIAMSLDYSLGCLLNNDGSVECRNFQHPDFGAVNVPSSAGRFAKVNVKGVGACGITDIAKLFCWDFALYPDHLGIQNLRLINTSESVNTFASGVLNNLRNVCWIVKSTNSIRCQDFITNLETEFVKFNAVPIDFSVGYTMGCALISNSSVQCWLMYNFAESSSNLTQPIKSVSTGWDHTCVTTTIGNVQCFGAAMLGQIGNGTHGACCGIDNSQDTNIPQTVISNTAVTQLALGGNHSCAIQNGGAWCWGDNHNGQVGNGNTTDANTPVQVTGLISGVTKLAAGSHNTCAIQNATLKCWGWNDRGQVGDGSTADWWLPTPVISLTQPVSDVAIGGAHACAVSVNGALSCWGRNDYGQLGDGTSGNNRLAPVAVKGINNVVEVAPADTHTCARTINGKVYCWGWNYLGSLGNGSLDWVTVVTPTLVSGINGSVTQIAAERNRTCVLTSLGAVQCWGNGIAAPVTVPGLEANVKSFDIGVDHGCAAMQDNTLRCWGSNAHGQRADSIMASSYISTPTTVVGFDGAPWRSVYLPVVLR